MSNFICDKCGTECIDSPIGFVTGCDHYPADVQRLPDNMEKVLQDNLWNLYATDDSYQNHPAQAGQFERPVMPNEFDIESDDGTGEDWLQKWQDEEDFIDIL